MAKLDRLRWAGGIAFRAFGCRVGIRVNDPGILDRVRALLPPGWKPVTSSIVDQLFSLIVGGHGRGGTRRFNIAYAGDAQIARSLDLDETLRVLEIGLDYHIAEFAPRRIFVHAGVVGWDGQAILIPGRSWTGKTTLVESFLKAGATYYSDEFAVLDERGRVHPYPIPLATRKNGRGHATVKKLAEALGGRVGRRPLPVGLVIVTRYRRGARWRPRQLGGGKALLELLNHTIPARRRPRQVLDVLSKVVAGATTLKGVRGGAPALLARLRQREDPLGLRPIKSARSQPSRPLRVVA
jgi:hypothetical protein